MKNIIVTLATVLISVLGVNAQTDSVTVVKTVNEMTDKVSYNASFVLLATNDGEKGLRIRPYLADKKLSNFMVYTYMMGSKCNKDNTLIIKFSDDTKIKLSSWNEFDCKNSYFKVTPELLVKLKTLEIEKIYFLNGDSYESGTFKVEDKRYFIQLIKGL